MRAYYNEIDPFAADWLRNLMAAGHIMEGEVDERDIREVQPADLRGFTRVHMFAGIGVWDYALRLAGWPDDWPVWTGSCPCQPFSAAGRRAGTADERHLWPEMSRLIRECRPERVFGEQVASPDGLAWLDLVCADLEGEGYAVGALDICAAGLGAPHIRQRLWWVADAGSQRRQQIGGSSPCDEATHGRKGRDRGQSEGDNILAGDGATGGLADAATCRWPGADRPGEQEQRFRAHGNAGGLADAAYQQFDGCGGTRTRRRLEPANGGATGGTRQRGLSGPNTPGPTNGFWADAQWLPCRDQKARPVEPLLESVPHGLAAGLGLVRLERRARGDESSEVVTVFAPLVAGGKGRVGRLRGYGNSIVAPVAAAFVSAYMGGMLAGEDPFGEE